MTHDDTQDDQNEAQEPVAGLHLVPDATEVPEVALKPRPLDLIADANRKVSVALDRVSLGERTEYSVSMVAMPDPQGNVMPVLMIVVAIPSLLIGQKISTSVLLQTFAMEQEDMDRLLSDVMRQLRDSRSEQGQINGQAPGLPQFPH